MKIQIQPPPPIEPTVTIELTLTEAGELMRMCDCASVKTISVECGSVVTTTQDTEAALRLYGQFRRAGIQEKF